MITYSKCGWAISLLFRSYGSAIPRSVPVAAACAAVTAYLHFFWGEYLRAVWRNPFPFQIFGTIVGFIVVFRCQPSPQPCERSPAGLSAASKLPSELRRCWCAADGGPPAEPVHSAAKNAEETCAGSVPTRFLASKGNLLLATWKRK